MRPSNLYFALPVLKTFSQLALYDKHIGSRRLFFSQFLPISPNARRYRSYGGLGVGKN